MKKITFIILVLFVMFLFTGLTIPVQTESEAESEEMVGRFTYKTEGPISRLEHDSLPLEKVADTLDYNFNWDLWQGEVRGNIDDINFTVDDFIVYRNRLYIPIIDIEEILGLRIKKRGHTYYLYQKEKIKGDELELKINTHTDEINRDDPLAVTILLPNNTGEEVELRFSSSQRFDLVLTRFDREVWRLSDGRGYAAVSETKTLEDGEYLLFTELLDLNVGRGKYELTAEITARDKTITSEPLSLEINR
ncbi:MAG: BsuPI-related putative proteinase inhibitor [Halanaerobiales bacterium]